MDAQHNPGLSPGTVIAYAGILPAPWRNGGGVTRQIASGKLDAAGNPESVSGDTWDWRISIAEVGTAGDFSAFDGINRILTVVDGGGLAVSIDGDQHSLEPFTPLRFDGGAATSATLPHGPIRDLNLMTRTGTVNGHVEIVELAGETGLGLSTGSIGILLKGRARMVSADRRGRDLEPYDAVIGGGKPAPVLSGSGLMAVLSISSAATDQG